MSRRSHFTTRRGFIAAAGFGGVSLYGLWAAYGAAPGPLALAGFDGLGHGVDGHDAPAVHGHAAGGSGGGHGAHGPAEGGPSPDEFLRMTSEFVERYRLPDGTVHPRPMMAVMHGGHVHQGGHAHPAADPEAIEVLMVAGRFYYLPQGLRLEAGTPYLFRMMAVDASHGASIQFGAGARMVRLRPGRISEIEMNFRRPGRYLVLCTVYCGAAHDIMKATIEVV